MIDLLSFQHFHFLRPYWLIIFVIMVLVIRAFISRDDTLALWRNVMSEEILKSLTIKGNSQHWLSPKRISLLLLVPIVILLIGPTWKQQPSPFSENKAVLVIALDVSETMLQSDVQPSRLLRAKQKILELLEIRGDTNTALIAYAGSAHVVMPVTNDRQMISHFLDVLEPKIMPKSGKLPQTILPLVKQLIEPSGVPGTLLLMGDGATSETTEKFNDFFATYNNQLIVWAFGNDKETINEQSSSIIPLQLKQLEDLTDASHGRLVRMTNDKEDLVHVNRYIEHNLIVVDDKSRPWYDSGYPMIFIIALLYLFWFRKGWTLQW